MSFHPAISVLDECKIGSETYYLVRWTGFPPSHDSWTKEITRPLFLDWKRKKRPRKWSKMMRFERILKKRKIGSRTEYLIQWTNKRHADISWTPFVGYM